MYKTKTMSSSLTMSLFRGKYTLMSVAIFFVGLWLVSVEHVFCVGKPMRHRTIPPAHPLR